MNGGRQPVDEGAADGEPVDEEGQEDYVEEDPVPANSFVEPWSDDT
jgi:hypothetical protein